MTIFRKHESLSASVRLCIAAACLSVGSLAVGSLAVGIASSPVLAQDSRAKVDPEADRVLAAMARYMGSLSSFSASYSISSEIVTSEGQKLQYVAGGELSLRRPDKLRATRNNGYGEVAIVIDGKTVSLVDAAHGRYFQTEATPSIERTVDKIRDEIGLDAPGADLLDVNSYKVLMEGVRSGSYLGKSVINRMECHHLAFRNERTDWQIWVRVGDTPHPCRYVITTKWFTAAPQYSLDIIDWKANPSLADDLFRFQPAANAVRLPSVTVNEIGEVVPGAKP